jgi:hypothetical protein
MKWLWRIFPRRLVRVGEADIGERHLGTRVGERYTNTDRVRAAQQQRAELLSDQTE